MAREITSTFCCFNNIIFLCPNLEFANKTPASPRAHQTFKNRDSKQGSGNTTDHVFQPYEHREGRRTDSVRPFSLITLAEMPANVFHRYESEHNDVIPNKKSGGQMGAPQTAVDVQPEAAAKEKAEKGLKTAENIRYGQGISETGAGGFTSTSSGDAAADGFGRQKEKLDDAADAMQSRKAEGYGGDKDMNTEIGA